MTARIRVFPILPPCWWSRSRNILHKQRCQPLLFRKCNNHSSVPTIVTPQLELKPSFCSIFFLLFLLRLRNISWLCPRCAIMWRSSRRNAASDSHVERLHLPLNSQFCYDIVRRHEVHSNSFGGKQALLLCCSQ